MASAYVTSEPSAQESPNHIPSVRFWRRALGPNSQHMSPGVPGRTRIAGSLLLLSEYWRVSVSADFAFAVPADCCLVGLACGLARRRPAHRCGPLAVWR